MTSQHPVTYDMAMAMFEAASKSEVGLRPYTVLMLRDQDDSPAAVDLFLYAARIATLYADGTVRLDRCGHNTFTTKNRLSDAVIPLGWRVVIIRREWMLASTVSPRRTMPFIDGMIVHNIIKNNTRSI